MKEADQMYLFFDTETTGRPRNYKAPVTDVSNWPRVVQLAFMVTDPTGAPLSAEQFLIRPDGFSIPQDATRVHGITTERAMTDGIPVVTALNAFLAAIGSAETLVAHNISFDENVLGAEFLRAGLPNPLPKKKRCCTMISATAFCGIPGPYGPKWPSLSELHVKLFQREFQSSHSASGDVQACADCFFALKLQGIISA
jgi:DNA polymerase-3 subunit epsilon